ncbi:MAG: GFA family protein [Kangiellaceae bacterium]
MTTTGACFCGAVSYIVKLPSLWASHCHCTMCQKIHGAAFVTWVGFDHSRITIDDQLGHLCWYQSSHDSERGHCSKCGSNLFFRSAKWENEIHITRTSFLTPIDREPQVHSYYDTHVSWLKVNDQLIKKPDPENVKK